jgi:hypothetical protein
MACCALPRALSPIRADASRWLALTEAELLGGKWIDPEAGRVPFSEYAAAWLDERPGLRPKTLQLYRYLLRAHLQDEFGPRMIASITEADVRRWRADLPSASVSPVTAAKAYRLLKGILATATEDGLIPRNPCRVKGASVEKSPERPVLTVAQVYTLADVVGPRYRALILLACFCGLRGGELAGLQRGDIDTERRTIRVARQLSEVAGRPLFFAPPKSDAGKRLVAIPSMILPDLLSHLASFTLPRADALLFTSRQASCCGSPIPVAVLGSQPSPHPAWTFTFTTCATRGTSWSLRPGPTSANSGGAWAIRPAGPRSSTCTPRASDSTGSQARWPPACRPNLIRPRRTKSDPVARMWHARPGASDGELRLAESWRSDQEFRGRPEQDSNLRPTA